MGWVLIVMMGLNSGAAILQMHDFSSKDRCEKAAELITAEAAKTAAWANPPKLICMTK